MFKEYFIVSLSGVLADFITTRVGLGLGFCETNPYYNPIFALAIFWCTISILVSTLPKRRPWNLFTMGLALSSYLGAINNTLVMLQRS